MGKGLSKYQKSEETHGIILRNITAKILNQKYSAVGPAMEVPHANWRIVDKSVHIRQHGSHF